MNMSSRLPYPDTQYARTIANPEKRPEAEGNIKAEVVIIGGGLAGLTAARELAVAGKSPVLIEAQAVAYGASGRNGGFVSPGYACGHEAIVQRTGADNANALFKLSLEAVDYVRARAESYGAKAGIDLRNGIMSVRRLPGGEDLRKTQEWLSGFGYETEYLNRDEVRTRANSPKYFEALRTNRAFHIHPLNYARALAADAENLGAQIFEATPAQKLSRTADGYIITTPKAQITADQVVVTTGGYTGNLIPKLRQSYVPVATYVMASETEPDLLAQAITTRDAIGDNRRAGDYYRLIEDGQRLLWGGAITVRDRDPEGVTAYLRHGLIDTYPQLEPLKFDVSWSGWMSYARHQMPQVGQISPGLWHATAFGGHGLNTTAAAARVVAEAIAQGSDQWKLFQPWGLEWTGGPIGRLAAQATYWWLQWQDRRQEAAVA